jgi:DNA invertase Pin-like site-specific DNA recombinase
LISNDRNLWRFAKKPYRINQVQQSTNLGVRSSNLFGRANKIKRLNAFSNVGECRQLARSTRDLLNVLDTISKKGAGFRSIADAWADTTTPHGRLLLTVLGGLAEFERELIKARTDEGRKRAMARGVKFGRKLKLTRHQIAEAIARREAGEPLAEIGRSYNVSHSTISRLG